MAQKDNNPTTKQASERKGRTAEKLAAILLRLKGYAIIAERYRTNAGEVDIIARKGEVVAFVEVKARKTQKAALESITRHQRSRIEKTALLWSQAQPSQEFAMRFDVITVAQSGLPSHMVDAWRPEW